MQGSSLSFWTNKANTGFQVTCLLLWVLEFAISSIQPDATTSFMWVIFWKEARVGDTTGSPICRPV